MSFQSLTASASLVSLAIAQASGNFISPGPQGTDGNLDGNSAISLTFQYGEPQVFAWKATISSVTLALWQNGSSPVEDTISSDNTQGSFIWNGIPLQSLDQGQTFYAAIYEPGAVGPFAYTEYFNISRPAVASISVSTTTIESAPTHSDSSRSTTVTSTSGTTSSSPAVISSTNNNTLVIGLGAGLGCALLFTFLAGAFFFRGYKRKHQITDPSYSKPELAAGGVYPATESHAARPGHVQSPVQELPAHSPATTYRQPQEKPGQHTTLYRSASQ